MNVHLTMIHWRIPGMLLATTDKALHHQFNVTLSRLDDQPRRWMVALESKKISLCTPRTRC